MTHQHPVLDRDTPFYIEPTTRTVYNNLEGKILMQGDHNCERFTFNLPRYVEDHDMSLCNKVEIHFINQNEKSKKKISSGIYIPDDLSKDEDYVTFSWLLTEDVTKFDGKVSFVIKLMCVEGDEVTYRYQTMIFSDIIVAPSILIDTME